MTKQTLTRTLDMMTSTSYQGSIWAREKHGDALGQVVWALAAFSRWLTQYTPASVYRRVIKHLTALDYAQIDDVEVDGINHSDHPDYCDAYIASASYKGREMTESELERLNEDSSYVYDCVIERIY